MRILGLDGGIASVGWAIVDFNLDARLGVIVKCGTRMFHSPEGQSSSGTPVLKNAERRANRSQRKVIRRRRQRMSELRNLLKDHGLLKTNEAKALAGNGADLWSLRADALDKLLSPHEFALILGHIAKHRGFQSNKKGEKVNRTDETSKMLSAIEKTQERLVQYRTVGEMFARDQTFKHRKRNRDEDYTRSILRDDHRDEIRKIFNAQRKLGNNLANVDLEDAYTQLAFYQRPIQSSLDLVAQCAFIEGEKRASAFAPSFEKFRFLSKLTTVRIIEEKQLRTLTRDEIAAALAVFGKTKTFSWKTLRKTLALEDTVSFYQVGPDQEKKDFVRAAGAAAGTKSLLDILKPVVGDVQAKSLLSKAEPLDKAITVIAFNDDINAIRQGLEQCNLSKQVCDALCEATNNNFFNFIKGTGHISNAAARALNPHLANGYRYDQACATQGWDHAAQQAFKLEDIGTPVAQKAAREMLKQVKLLDREYGPFDRIHVEMARDVGKSIEERSKIKSGLERRTKQREKSASELKELLNLTHVSGEDILRFELWREQAGRCLYSGTGITPSAILAKDNSIQVDHILPFSRFADNTFHNKTLCYTAANQGKQNRTPHEWIAASNPADWDRFCADVTFLKGLKGIKKRNYLLMDASVAEEKFLARNLNDTRYALKVILGILRKKYPDFADGTKKDGTVLMRRRVFARPGGIISALRHAWGVESLKKDPETGDRIADDRHHALDAIITACCSEALLQQATRHAQINEKRGEKFELRQLAPPWGKEGTFRRDVKQAMEDVFVSRPEAGRLRGKGHEATIKQIRNINGEEHLLERKPVAKLNLADLERIPMPKPYGKIVDPGKLRDQLVNNLRDWIIKRDEIKKELKKLTGKSDQKTALQTQLAALRPLSPKGDVVRKVRLEPVKTQKVAVRLRGGSAAQSEMVRVDVFTKPKANGIKEFYYIPIYRSDVYTSDPAKIAAPPNKAVVANKPGVWLTIDETFIFQFSLVSFSLVELVTSKGEKLRGYFRGLHAGTGALSLSPPQNASERAKRSNIGGKTLKTLKKFHVDRLGNISEIKQEKRTWRGKVCI
ncbi:MAG: type II CRISPR RNA-guided endonuclease Cas9 [Cohaesibacter sp.]|nr:type II CRISPR RNA-guided endonuclease Cas9 [Cohaesibacter sp.]